MSGLPASTDVAIVGAGPTGLSLAGILARREIPFVLLDRLEAGAETSRAAVVHAHTLEVLEELGVTDRLRAAGRVVPCFSVRDRDRLLITVRFEGLPTAYPYALMIPQNVTEAILLSRLRELGADVDRPYMVNDLRQSPRGVTLTMSRDVGQPRTLRARYVVGADGMHSIVRERAGIRFRGDAYGQSFVLADIRMSWSLRADEVTLLFSPQGLVVVAPLPGGRHRVVATVDDPPERPGIEFVQGLLDDRGPVLAAAHVDEVVWSSRLRVHHRVAERFRAGRILLAGDAAHVHSPAGGQGMNIGIQDAVRLAHALADVLEGRAPDSRLDEYERNRRPVAQRVVSLTDRMTRAATLHGHRARSVRNGALRLLGRIPGVRRWLAVELAELRYA